jgi:hypothetical protein
MHAAHARPPGVTVVSQSAHGSMAGGVQVRAGSVRGAEDGAAAAGSSGIGDSATRGAQGRGANPARDARAAWSSASSKTRTGPRFARRGVTAHLRPGRRQVAE